MTGHGQRTESPHPRNQEALREAETQESRQPSPDFADVLTCFIPGHNAVRENSGTPPEEGVEQVRSTLARRLNAGSERLHFVPTVRLGITSVARSLSLGPGDEVMTSSHEYPVLLGLWRELARRRGFVLRELEIPSTHDELLASWTFSPATRVLYFSHVTPLTALLLPVEELCRRARQAGVATVIDGAHGFGHVEVDLARMRPDYYVGCLHKWVGAPCYGAAFVYGRAPESLRPEERLPFLAARAALDRLDVRPGLELAREARRRFGTLAWSADEWCARMTAFPLPAWVRNLSLVRSHLEKRGLLASVHRFAGQPMIRCAFQAEHDSRHLDRLERALREVLGPLSRLEQQARTLGRRMLRR